MNLWKLVVAMLMATALLSSCAKDDEPQVSLTLRAVNGDPWVYVKSTSNNGDSASFPAQLFENNPNESWYLTYYGFREQKLNGDKASRRSFKSGSRQLPRTVKQIKTESYVSFNHNNRIFIKFKKNDDEKFTIDTSQDILFYGEKQKVVHYSYTPDMNTFSVLFYITSNSGLKALIAIAGTKALSNTKASENKSEYFNLIGDIRSHEDDDKLIQGYKVSWDPSKRLNFDKCFLPYDGLNEIVDNSYKAWTAALKGRLNTSLNSKSDCPPFSDLNTHTVQYIDDWIEVNGPSGVMGLVWPTFFRRTGFIEDADMFIYKSELAEFLSQVKPGINIDDPATYKKYGVQMYMSWVITHEFGHMLGLGHKMKGPNSVMSYNSTYFSGSIFKYDSDAIAYLYPKEARRLSTIETKQD